MRYNLQSLGIVVEILKNNGRYWPNLMVAWVRQEIRDKAYEFEQGTGTFEEYGNACLNLINPQSVAEERVKAVNKMLYNRLQEREKGACERFLKNFDEYQEALSKVCNFKRRSFWYRSTHLGLKLKLFENLHAKDRSYSIGDLVAVAADLFEEQHIGTVDDFMALLLLR